MDFRTNPELELAYKFVNNTGEHLFLTGKAGTGKTTFLRNLQLNLKKKLIITAPTGVAAINAGGVTLHSFFQIPFGEGTHSIDISLNTNKIRKEKIKIIKGLDLLVIDEISMVRADLLDAVDSILRRYRFRHKPFGGVQLLMIGDMRQLSPVVNKNEIDRMSMVYATPYFFSSKVWSETSFVTIELKEIFRQSDAGFIKLLNNVRDGVNIDETLQLLNKQHDSTFLNKERDDYITLTTHNYQADSINGENMSRLKGKSYFFEAKVEGIFPESLYPMDYKLELKEGAQVMFLKNDINPQKRYFNGKIGRVVRVDDEMVEVLCKGDSEVIKVVPEAWSNCDFTIDEKTKSIVETVKGSFNQIPLKLAWAITVHKSQGLTFDKVVIDANRAFAHGQLYVALSRCRSLEGIVLSSKICKSAIVDDRTISTFCTEAERNSPTEQLFELSRKRYFIELVNELFYYDNMIGNLKYIYTLVNQHYTRQYRELLSACSETVELAVHELQEVAFKFNRQLVRMQTECQDIEQDANISSRVSSGIVYFKEKHEVIFSKFIAVSQIEFDNKVVAKSYEETISKLMASYNLKKHLLTVFANKGFRIAEYLKEKSDFELSVVEKAKATKSKKDPVPIDVKYPELFEKLKSWRMKKAKEKDLPAYTVLSQTAIKSIATTLPMTVKELKKINGVGDKIIENYGDDILTMVIDYCTNKGIKTLM